jgi:hypothetical protein
LMGANVAAHCTGQRDRNDAVCVCVCVVCARSLQEYVAALEDCAMHDYADEGPSSGGGGGASGGFSAYAGAGAGSGGSGAGTDLVPAGSHPEPHRLLSPKRAGHHSSGPEDDVVHMCVGGTGLSICLSRVPCLCVRVPTPPPTVLPSPPRPCRLTLAPPLPPPLPPYPLRPQVPGVPPVPSCPHPKLG